MATTTKEQAQPEPGHEACPTPAGPGQAAALQEVKHEVQQLQERLHDLEQRPPDSTSEPRSGVFSDPDHPASTVSLQDVLPRIKDLAQCVGGMKELARLVTMLAESKDQ
jgi:hypothetical protein